MTLNKRPVAVPMRVIRARGAWCCDGGSAWVAFPMRWLTAQPCAELTSRGAQVGRSERSAREPACSVSPVDSEHRTNLDSDGVMSHFDPWRIGVALDAAGDWPTEGTSAQASGTDVHSPLIVWH